MASLLIVGRITPTNVALHDVCADTGIRARLLPPDVALRRAQPDELVLGRIDVLAELGGVEAGLETLRRLEDLDLLVLNRADALEVAHDKLLTAQALWKAGLPHPRTAHVWLEDERLPAFGPPYVVKPRFGSWGKEVVRCDSRTALRRTISELHSRPWYAEQGVLVQELVPNDGSDLRVLVAGGTVVGAVSRVAADGEWRTNVALGARREPVVLDPEAESLAVAAVAAVDGDLMGVDLLPSGDGYTVLEVNGCVDFNEDYAVDGHDVFREAVLNLVFPGLRRLATIAAPFDEPVPEGV